MTNTCLFVTCSMLLLRRLQASRGPAMPLQLSSLAAAQEALPCSPQGTNGQPDSQKPYQTRGQGAYILHVISRSLTPQMAQSLAKRGLVGPLLQV
jgi:hypothetical protein